MTSPSEQQQINLDVNLVLAEYQRIISDLTAQLAMERARNRQMETQRQEERNKYGEEMEIAEKNGQISTEEVTQGS